MAKSATERRQQFENIVAKAEREFDNNPNAYKNKLKWLAFIGYGYLFFILFLCLSFLAGLVWMAIKSTVFLLFLIKSKMIVLVLGVVYVIFRSLFIKIPEPEGLRINKKDAPALFKKVSVLRKQLKTPKIHSILLTPELNAAIHQRPRLGLFGWQKNTLILGADLLMCLNEEQAMAVIAHELGHLSGGHSKFNGWIYRIRISWLNIQHAVMNVSTVAKWVFGYFFSWYAPYFNAYSFALARANEFEADAIATKATSSEALAQALVGLEVMSESYFSSYWKKVEKQVFVQPHIDMNYFLNSYKNIQTFQLNPAKQQAIIAEKLKAKTNLQDTHPALKDRLTAIDAKPEFSFNPKTTVSEVWFTHFVANYLTPLAQEWLKDAKQYWQETHAKGQDALNRINELDKKTPLSEDELLEKAHLQLFLQQRTSALHTFKEVLSQNKNEPNALYHIGAYFLEKNHAKGAQFLERLLHNGDYAQEASHHLLGFYQQNNMAEEAERIQLTIDHLYDQEEALYEEVTTTHVKDDFFRTDLSKEELSALKKSVRKYDGIRHAWVCQKRLKTNPDAAMFVILFELHTDESEAATFEADHPLELNGYYTFVNIEHKKLANTIRNHTLQLF
ncbi:MAG: M48 family metalloprotease [Marinicella pacifica]